MNLERSKNAKRSILWGIIYKIVMLVFPFLVRSAIIKTVGIEYLGLSGLFTSILEILNLTELGVGSAIVYSMYKPIAENDTKTMCALLNLFKKIYRIIGLIIAIIGLCLMPFLRNLIHGDIPSNADIYVFYILYLANTISTYWLFAYKTCLLNAYQRNDIISIVGLGISLILNISQILLLILFKNFYLFVVAIPISTVMTNVINAYLVKRLFPEYNCCGQIPQKMKTDIKKRISGLMLAKIAFRARYSIGNIVVSAFLGIKLLALYNNYFYIVNALTGFLTVIIVSIAAGIGNSIAIDGKEKNEHDMKILNFSYLSISFFCYCFLLCLYQPFMELWVGSEYMLDNHLMVWFALFFLSEKCLSIPGQYYDSAGLWWDGKWKGLIEVSIHLVLILIMSWKWGILGTLLSTTISITFVGLPLVSYYLYKYYFHKKHYKFMYQQLGLYLVLSIIGLVVYYTTNFCSSLLQLNIIVDMFVRIILSAIFALSLYLAIFYKTLIFKESLQWCLIRFIKR